MSQKLFVSVLYSQSLLEYRDKVASVTQGVPRACFHRYKTRADAQFAYLCKTGIVDAVVTEDSDLIVFGCPNVIIYIIY